MRGVFRGSRRPGPGRAAAGGRRTSLTGTAGWFHASDGQDIASPVSKVLQAVCRGWGPPRPGCPSAARRLAEAARLAEGPHLSLCGARTPGWPTLGGRHRGPGRQPSGRSRCTRVGGRLGARCGVAAGGKCPVCGDFREKGRRGASRRVSSSQEPHKCRAARREQERGPGGQGPAGAGPGREGRESGSRAALIGADGNVNTASAELGPAGREPWLAAEAGCAGPAVLCVPRQGRVPSGPASSSTDRRGGRRGGWGWQPG